LPQPEPDVNASEPASTPARLAGRSSKDATARPVENATVSAEVEPARDAPAAAAEPLGEGPVIPAAPPPMAMDPQSLAAADEIASLVERRQAEERQRTMAWARRARPAPGSNETASLSEETALLRQAKVQLDAGDAPAALRLLRKHARAFRDGSMVDVAAGLRVAALCEAGRDRQARQAARALARRAPDSPLTAEVPRRCR
jgi:hypothetical protein